MKLKICLIAVFVFLFAVGNVQAQTQEEVWREYQFLEPSLSEMWNTYFNLDEPYYSLMLKHLATKSSPKKLNRPYELTFLITEMIRRIPFDYEYLFHEFWSHLSLEASQDNLSDILVSYKVDKFPADLNWFIEDVVDTFWRKETSFFAIRMVICSGPNKYKQMFMEKYFSLNPSSYNLASSVLSCDKNKKLFLTKLLAHPDLTKRDLLDVLGAVECCLELHDYFFSLLLARQNELDINDLAFIENSSFKGSYHSIFSQLRFSAGLQRRQELLEIMRKK